MTNKIALSIVTHNSKHIFEVLDNLKQQLEDSSAYEVHIFDNHSEPDYVSKLKAYEPFIILHQHDANSGFGYGHNQVFRDVTADYGIIFNPDVLVTKTDMDDMVERIRQDHELAVI